MRIDPLKQVLVLCVYVRVSRGHGTRQHSLLVAVLYRRKRFQAKQSKVSWCGRNVLRTGRHPFTRMARLHGSFSKSERASDATGRGNKGARTVFNRLVLHVTYCTVFLSEPAWPKPSTSTRPRRSAPEHTPRFSTSTVRADTEAIADLVYIGPESNRCPPSRRRLMTHGSASGRISTAPCTIPVLVAHEPAIKRDERKAVTLGAR